MRKIAANYIYLPHYPLVKNGYVILRPDQPPEVVDTNGEMREIQGLEFYGGLLVPVFLCGYAETWQEGEGLIGKLDNIYRRTSLRYDTLAIIEGVDLRAFKWKAGGRIRRII